MYRSSSPALENYAANIVHDGDLDQTLNKIAPYWPVAVMAGGEYGVAFADVLSEALGLPSNGTLLSEASRDKAAMVEAVRAASLLIARQLRPEAEAEGSAADLADVTVFLTAPASDYIHGTVPPVDGGWLSR